MRCFHRDMAVIKNNRLVRIDNYDLQTSINQWPLYTYKKQFFQKNLAQKNWKSQDTSAITESYHPIQEGSHMSPWTRVGDIRDPSFSPNNLRHSNLWLPMLRELVLLQEVWQKWLIYKHHAFLLILFSLFRITRTWHLVLCHIVNKSYQNFVR